jgi:glycosyltransferase involved in cell wall biosynthesis
MFLSYIYSINGSDLEKVKHTLESINAQTDKDFEIIVLSDVSENSEETNQYVRDFFWANKNVKFVENSELQGVAVSWNTGLEICEGEYSIFVNASDVILPNHIETLKKARNELGEIDIFEYTVHLGGLADSATKSFIDKNKVYHLKKTNEPFAFINDLIQSKAFKTSVIKTYAFKFRRFVRYDMLFTYKFLGQAQTYAFVDSEPILETRIEETNFSIFDLTNQWPHVFNYYRRIGKFREISDELNYAYYKTIVHIWLWWVKKYKNKVLMKKAIAFAQRKFEDKRESFMNSNKVYKLKKDETFTDIVENFGKWLKEILKSI